MSRFIPVTYEGTPCYDIMIEHNFSALLPKLKELGYSKDTKVCILTDSNVEKLYLKSLKQLLHTEMECIISYTFPAGEKYKNLDTIYAIYQKLIEASFDRQDLLLALGGGVTGDMCGFVAATYLRGIDFIQIPTTLLAQVDSSIGGKTGVDFGQYKNMVGAFYQPKLVYMNLTTLRDLPAEHFRAGMGEILKHGLIKDAAYFSWLIQRKKEIAEMQPEILEEMIGKSCEIKREVVERDPREKGERALLNFGHTIGHAIEKLSKFQLIHGYCVAIGIAAACDLSVKKGTLSKEESAYIRNVLVSFGLPVTTNLPMDAKDVLEASKHDKKMAAGQIKFILLNHPGEACIDQTVTDEEMISAITAVLADPENNSNSGKL